MTTPVPVQDKVIVALDTASLGEAKSWLESLKGVVTFYKIGLELFIAYGWQAVDLVQKYGGKVFLDLKLHDIPNTVSRSLRSACEHGVEIVNLHAFGGLEMMKMAREAVEKFSEGSGKRPKLIAVTILTSHSQGTLSGELGIRRKVQNQVLHLARLAQKAGLDGIVCSPQETSMVRKKLGGDFLIVTPGVRPAGSAKGDQKRIETPEKAVRAGADHLVIGRPITQAPDPKKAAVDIFESLAMIKG
ncbi:MAG TPA: orotidine-5'-phosphate decarboxylase [Candidatus Omnitrophota bacterium]|jgi:orotidine-5'-phosphate decarboxylase|nr:orotidine-5'-phosphate decarboxylase [Candidatus Omnitrophota bacterium]